MSDCAKSPTGVHVSAGESACAWCGEDWMRVLAHPAARHAGRGGAHDRATSNTRPTSEAIDAVLAFVGPVGDDSGVYPDGLTAEGMDTLTQLLWAVVRAASREAGAPQETPEWSPLFQALDEWAESYDNGDGGDCFIGLMEDVRKAWETYRQARFAGSPPTSGEGR